MMTHALRDPAEVMRDEMVMKDRIADLLADQPRTVAELAELLGHPTRDVMLWLMAMRRYGQIEEVGSVDDDGYFRYQTKPESLAPRSDES